MQVWFKSNQNHPALCTSAVSFGMIALWVFDSVKDTFSRNSQIDTVFQEFK